MATKPATTKEIAPRTQQGGSSISAATLEKVLMKGDLSELTEAQRLEYYQTVCKSLKLSPYTRPFEYLTLNGRLTLYARRDATDQLRKIHGISVEIISKEFDGDLYIVHVRARMRGPYGDRTDEDFGAIPFKKAATEAAANTILKTITKAKRRVTLSIAGLGWLDESEIGGARGDKPATISETQRKQLIELARQVDADMPSFLDYLGDRWELDIVKAADIPLTHFQDALDQLERKRAALERTEAEAPRHDDA